MPDTVRSVYCYSTMVSNKPGQAFHVLQSLVSAGINLLACQGVPAGRRARLDVVPDNARKLSTAARKAGIHFKQQRAGFLIQGEDRPGALAAYLERLADAGINVVGVDGVSGGSGRWGAIIWVDTGENRRAGSLLRAAARRH